MSTMPCVLMLFCRCYNWFSTEWDHSEWKWWSCTHMCSDKVWLCQTGCWSQLVQSRWHSRRYAVE